jgi:hypothetical protein
MKKLEREQCLAAMADGEFPADLRASSPSVAVILTQSWCPQWKWMRSYLERLPDQPGRSVFWIEYDLEDFFEPFMAFKEDRLGNREIPYVRYYRDGRLARQSNFIDEGGFLRLLQGGERSEP